jgi:hypothetical protein
MDQFVMNVCEDIAAIRSYLQRHNTERVPEVAIAYLASNYGLIEFLLEQAYTNHSQDERRDLAKAHRELNEASADDDFFDIAKGPLDEARDYWISYDTGDTGLSDDELHQLLRGLEYAKYLSNSGGRLRLLLHPIDRYLA